MVTRRLPRAVAGGDMILPPVFRAVRLREVGDAFAHAQTIAAKSGAGTLVHVGRFDLAEFALVLEPEEPLRSARRVIYAGMTALINALAAHAAPETAIGVEWPDAIYVNYGLVGGARLAWPTRTGEEEIPPWLVFGAMIRMVSMTGAEAGADPSRTTLEEEGFDDMSADRLIEGFSRHFMAAVEAWQEDGFAAAVREYGQRLPRENGLRGDIDESGDLLLRGIGGSSECKSLLQALASPSWIDPKTKLPYA